MKSELEDMRASMGALLAEKFTLEQCVRYLAVKGCFVPGEASVASSGVRSALDSLAPGSLREPVLASRPSSAAMLAPAEVRA